LTVYYGVLLDPRGGREFRLDDANKILSVRFTARETRIVVSIHIEFNSAVDPPTYRIGLQDDSDGKPSGIWLTSATIKPSNASPPGSWVVVPVSPCELKESKVYHLLIRYESGTIGENNYIRHFGEDFSAMRLFPDDVTDDNYSVLWSTDGGVSWTSYTVCALKAFLLEFSDGSGYGFTYYEGSSLKVYGDQILQIYLQPTKRMILSSVEVYICKHGNPDDLTLVLRNETDGIDVLSVTISQGDIPPSWTYVGTTFPPVIIHANKVYTLTLKSPGADSSNYYELIGWNTYGELIYRKNSWGGTDNCLRISYDGGKSWYFWDYFDTVFRCALKFNPALKNAPNSGL
jgi:hypothetical protein